MDLDLKLYIPELNFEKTYRLPNPRMTLQDFELFIRSRISLPLRITFHQSKDPDSASLDIHKTLASYGYGSFDQEPIGLYIFENRSVIIQEPKDEDLIEARSDSSSVSEEEVEESPVVIEEDIIVTVLNSSLATSHIFIANRSLKMADFLENYKTKIEWNESKGPINLRLSLQENACDENNCIADIADNGEILLEVFQDTNDNQTSKRPLSSLNTNDKNTDVHIIEESEEGIETTRKEGQTLSGIRQDYLEDQSVKKIKTERDSATKVDAVKIQEPAESSEVSYSHTKQWAPETSNLKSLDHGCIANGKEDVLIIEDGQIIIDDSNP